MGIGAPETIIRHVIYSGHNHLPPRPFGAAGSHLIFTRRIACASGKRRLSNDLIEKSDVRTV